MTEQSELAPGHHWQETDRVAEYLQRTDADEARAIGFDLMTKLAPQDADAPVKILDIGSGQGVVASWFLEAFPKGAAYGLDISDAMMDEGRQRMARFGERFDYIAGDFGAGNLPAAVVEQGPYDLIVSARAIHHLAPEEIRHLYANVYGLLNTGGAFFNFDAAVPADPELKLLFRARHRGSGEQTRPQTDVRSLDQGETHSQDTTLANHLDYLASAGFDAVECFYKHLASTVVGGYKR